MEIEELGRKPQYQTRLTPSQVRAAIREYIIKECPVGYEPHEPGGLCEVRVVAVGSGGNTEVSIEGGDEQVRVEVSW